MKLFWTIYLSLLTISAFADVEVVTNVIGTSSANNLNLMLGGKFQNNSGQAINITKIGRYVLSGNSGTHKICVFTGDVGDFSLVASNTVNLSGATVGTFKYVSLTTSITIPNGGIFWVVSEETNGGDSWYVSSDVISISDIAVINSGYFDTNLHNNDGATNKLHVPAGFQIGEATGPSGGSGNAPAPLNFRTVPFEFGDNDGGWIDVVVAWDYPYTGQTGFNCRVSTNHVDWYLIASAQAIERGIDTLRVPWTSNLWFKIAAKNLSGESTNYSNEIKVTGNMPPSHWVGRSVLTNQIYLQCEGVGGLINGYTFRWATNNTFSPSNTFLTASQTVTNMTLTNNFLPNVRYFFQIVSTSVGGDSEVFDKPTNYISVIVNGVPDAPTFVSQHMTENANESTVIFDRNSLNELGYSLEFTTNNGSTWIVQPVAYDANETRTVVTLSSMLGGVLYSNRLAATNILGHSPYVYWVFTPPLTPIGTHTIYYVTNTPPVGGNATGTNWANAWGSLGAINWNILNPGDTVYLSGGNYTNYMVSFASGTQANPISIRASQEAGHNSHINIYGQIGFRSHWVTFSGSNGVSFASTPLSLMTNAIGISVFGRGDAIQEVWIGVDCIGLNTEYCEFTGAGNELSGEGAIAVHYLPNIAGPTNCTLKYVWIHDNFAHGIGADAIGTTYQGYRAIVVDHCLIENNHNNFISGSGSMHIENCVLGPWKGPGIGHPDGYQGGVNYLTAINNIWKNSGGSIFYANLAGSFFAPGIEGAHDCYFINNIFINDVTNVFSTGCDLQWNMDSVGSGMILSNVYIMNNTFFGRKLVSYAFSARTNNTLKQIKFENNLFLSGDQCSSGAGSFSMGGGIIPTTNDFVFNYNSVSGPQKIINWNHAQYASVDVFPVFTNNRSGTPEVISQNGLKFEAVFTDTNIVNRGTNLAIYRPFFQSNAATNDFLGTPRDSQWDIGAFEMSTNRGPVIWYTFEQDFYSDTTKYLPDVSGNNHPGLRFGRPSSKTNYPSRSDGYDGGYAGRFTYYTNDIQNGQPQYFTGDYIAMTNVTVDLRSISNFTVAFWAYIRERNNDMTFIGGGGALGNGNFAIKTVDNYTEVAIVTNGVRVEEGHLMVFPDIGISNQWHHFAVTWSGTNHTLKGYYDGFPFATNISLTSLYAIVFDQNSYIGNGCWTFDEDPWIFPTADGGPDQHPNNGWFAGSLDDYRVYTITLSDAEVLGLLGGGVAQNNFTPPTEPPATNTFTLTLHSFNPDSGYTGIAFSPADNNGKTTGVTPFTLVYNESALVTFQTFPSLVGKTFSKWQKDGNNYSTNYTITVTVDTNHTFTVVYTNNASPPPTNTYTVTVQSSNPNAGVTISTTVDNNGNGGGPTTFVRTFNENAIMALLAPSTLTGKTFSKWIKNGSDLSANPAINLTVNANQIVVAVYTNNPVPPPTPTSKRGPFKKNH